MNDLTDVVERYLRDTFAHDAAGAPAPYDLLDTAVRRGRAHRRRTAVVGATLSVVLVAAGVFLGRNVWSDATPAPLPGTQGGPVVPSGPPVADDESVLMFRGVEVPVPAAMLAPGNVPCGFTPIADAAYVVDRSLTVATCYQPEPPDLTLVVMRPLEDVTQAERAVGGHILPDGRYEVASAIPGRDVWLSVTSPDQKRADRLFGGAVIASSPKGCDVHPGPFSMAGGAVLLPPLSGGAIGRICGYRGGWLTGAALVSGAQLHDLFDLVANAPSDALLDCIAQPPAGDGWWLTLGESKAWVEGTSCSRVIVEGGGSGRLTDTLASLLWSLAPGPSTLDGVANASTCCPAKQDASPAG
jgi:hypothetical protein